jgi:elongation factor G
MRPDPNLLVEVAIEPEAGADRQRLAVALGVLARRDPFLRVKTDDESGQTIVSGRSERQLQGVVDHLRGEFGVAIRAGAPQVAYRESLAKPVELVYTHKKQSGGSGQFGEVKVAIEPGERGSGIIFTDEIKGGNIPREYIPSVEKGMRETAATGSLIGFPIIDFNIRLLDGKYHDVDSSALAFEITGRGAMREGARKAGIKLLEPIMKVVVLTASEQLDPIRANLMSRGVAILEILETDDARIIVATARLARLFGLDADLEAVSDGQAQSIMQLEYYAPVDAEHDPDTFPVSTALRA